MQLLDMVLLTASLLAPSLGAARFREHRQLDRLSLLISRFLSILGSGLMLINLLTFEQTAYLLPLSCLLTLQFTCLFLRNYFLELVGLPLISVQVLAIVLFHDAIWSSPTSFILGFALHLSWMFLVLYWALHLKPLPKLVPFVWSPYTLRHQFECWKAAGSFRWRKRAANPKAQTA